MSKKHDPSKPSRRSRPLRVENDEILWFVTSRTIEERFWLHPLLTSSTTPRKHGARRTCKGLQRRADKRLSQTVQRANSRRGPLQPLLTLDDAKRIARGLVGSALARAQQRYGAKLFAVTVMSDHFHLIVQTRGKNLAKFMGYVKSRVAESINLLTGKRGPLWSRRYDAQPILDDEAAAERLSYCLDNPVQAGLVESADSWPGLNLAFGIGETDTFEFEYVDRTAWHHAGRPEKLGKFYRRATLRLSPLPRLEGMERRLAAESVTSWLGCRIQYRDKGRKVLGIEKVLDTAFDSRPKAPKHVRRPYAFGSKENKTRYYKSASILYQAYAEASEQFRAGRYKVVFPEGMYRPPISIAA